jgi:LDH2 family malate/lactate/ureidoglycolate dehydrogenase
MDIFGGVISGANYGGDVGDQYKVYDRPQDVGHFFLAMKPDLFVPEEDYRGRMDTLIERVHACPPRKASTRFSCPASRSVATKTSGAGVAFPTAPTRSRRCRRKPPKPTWRRSACRSSRSVLERILD